MVYEIIDVCLNMVILLINDLAYKRLFLFHNDKLITVLGVQLHRFTKMP
jgi:hypothetical protein